MIGVVEMDIIGYLEHYLRNDNTKLLYLLALILGANILDFTLGYLNAKLNKKVAFRSNKAIMGIIRKVVTFILLIYFIPVSLLVPSPIGIGAIYILFGGYLVSEINSILSHLKMTDDGKEGDVFADFIQTIFSNLNKK